MKIYEEFVLRSIPHLFAEMHNPRYRGDKFAWEGFPEMARSLAETQVFMYYTRKIPKAISEEAGRLAYEYAQELVGLMTE